LDNGHGSALITVFIVFAFLVLSVASVGIIYYSGVLQTSDQTTVDKINVTSLEKNYKLTILKEGAGNVNPQIGVYSLSGSNSTLVSSTPDEGWVFDYYLVDGNETKKENLLSIDMNSNHTIKAVFKPQQYSLKINTLGEGNVDITPSNVTYVSGSVVQLKTKDSDGWYFSSWSGDLEGSSKNVSVKLDKDKVITAVFKKKEILNYSVSVNTVGTGLGIVNFDPPGGTYPKGTIVTISAQPQPGSTFIGWNRPEFSNNNPLSLNIIGDEVFSVNFTLNAPNLSLNARARPSNGGNVYVNNTGPYKLNDAVLLEAFPNEGYEFVGWSGDGFTVGLDRQVTIIGDMIVGAIFIPVSQSHLEINVSGEGSVRTNNSQTSYAIGTIVQLVATAAPGWEFSGWSGDVSGDTNPLLVDMSSDKNVIASFVELPDDGLYSINIVKVGSGSGSVNLSPVGGSYPLGTVVTLSSTASLGSTFSGWSGDVSGSSSNVSLAVTKNMAVTATFTQNSYVITSSAGSGGVISPSGAVSVAGGLSKSFTITPNSGYQVSGVLVDGVSVGAVSSFSFSNVQATHTIVASFSPVQNTPTSYYTVSVSGSTFTTKNPSNIVLYSGPSAISAINMALSSVNSGGFIYIKEGLYPISSTISGGKSHITITGDKTAILKASTSMGYLFVWSGSSTSHLTNFTLSNICFDGNLLSAGVSVKWCDVVVVDGVTIKNTKKTMYVDGFDIKGTSGSAVSKVVVKNSNISNIYGSGVAFDYVQGLLVDNCDFVDCAQVYPSGGAVLCNNGCQGVVITNNNVSGRSDNDGFYVGTSVSFTSNAVIKNNRISLRLYGTGGGAKYAGSGIKIYALSSEVSGNIIDWNNTPYVYGVANWGMGNMIYNNTVANAHVGYGSQSSYYNGGSTVTYNRISGCNEGMEILQTGSTVTGNILTDCLIPFEVVSGNILSGNTVN
jgi:hypothetical protein